MLAYETIFAWVCVNTETFNFPLITHCRAGLKVFHYSFVNVTLLLSELLSIIDNDAISSYYTFRVFLASEFQVQFFVRKSMNIK